MRSTLSIVCALGTLLACIDARGTATEGGASAPTTDTPAEPQAQPHAQPQAPAAKSLEDVFGDDPFAAAGFDTVTDAGPVATASIQEQADTRRTMLTIHQSLGLATLAAMAGVSVSGALNIHDLYGGGERSGKYLLPHRLGVYTLTGLFLSTGALSVLAPAPYEREGDHAFDTADGHKLLVSVATAGMVTQLILGFVTARRAEAGNPHALKKMATAHQVVGYGTLGALSAAALVWVL